MRLIREVRCGDSIVLCEVDDPTVTCTNRQAVEQLLLVLDEATGSVPGAVQTDGRATLPNDNGSV